MIAPGVADACCQIASVYVGDGPADDYVMRMLAALAADDRDEAEHVAALMVVFLIRREDRRATWTRELWEATFLAPAGEPSPAG